MKLSFSSGSLDAKSVASAGDPTRHSPIYLRISRALATSHAVPMYQGAESSSHANLCSCSAQQRPGDMQVLVEAKTSDDVVHSLLLQNAETVRLVGPASTSLPSEQAAGNGNEGEGQVSWRAVSVSEMQVGDRVFLRQQGAARHTGISINESILER